MAKSEQHYLIAYRIGGERMCKWRRVLGAYTLADARAKQAELERMGYASIVEREQSALALGLPIGWRAADVDWERDEIVYGAHETQWTSHKLLSAR
jgi:hypothetical protein